MHTWLPFILAAGLILFAAGVWLLLRDPTDPPQPGRHRRDPHELPLKSDDDPPGSVWSDWK